MPSLICLDCCSIRCYLGSAEVIGNMYVSFSSLNLIESSDVQEDG